MDFKNTISILRCPYCQSSIRLLDGNDLVQCQCDIYPILAGILYLQKNQTKEKILKYLQQKRKDKALASLAAFSFLSKIFFRLVPLFVPFYKKLGFKNLINFFKLLGYPNGWAKYLKNRDKIPSFFISLLVSDFIRSNRGILVDFGCGSGNLFPYYYQYIRPEKIIGIDKSFLNLYLSRLFFAKKDTLLVCADVEKGIPFQSKSAQIVLMSDFLHNLKNKSFFIKELGRITRENGQGAISHILNKKTPTWPNASGEYPLIIKNKIKKSGFKNCVAISNNKVWSSITAQTKIILEEDKLTDDSYAYNVFFSKNKLPKSLNLGKKERQSFKKTVINFYQDPCLKCLKK